MEVLKYKKAAAILLALLFMVIAVSPAAAQAPGPPALISPADGGFVPGTEILFFWNPVGGIISYDLEISKFSNFSSRLNNVTYYPMTPSMSVPGFLNDGTQYYWRVRAVNASGESSWVIRSFYNCASPPSGPELSYPGDASHTPDSPLIFMWKASGGAVKYHLQVSKQNNFANLDINENNYPSLQFIASLPNDGTTYYWRVRALNAANLGNWSAVRSFVKGSYPQVNLTPPVLISPAQNANVAGTSVSFNWNPVAGANHYVVQAARDSNFSDQIFSDPGSTGTSITRSNFPNNGTRIYWRVRAVAYGSGFGEWSTSSFISGHLPLPPVLISPANNSNFAGTSPIMFTWNPSDGATKYHLQSSSNINFSTFKINNSTLTATSYEISGSYPVNPQTIYWRVKAGNLHNNWSDWSEVRSYVHGPPLPPPVPTLISPAPNAQISEGSITFTWNPSAGATRYHIQVSRKSNFSNTDNNDDSLTTTSYVKPSSALETYYWRVRAGNTVAWSNWSEARSFNRVTPPPPIPEPVSPGIKANVPGTTVTFNWNPSSGATRYHLQVGTSSIFLHPLLFNNDDIGSTQMAVPGFPDDGTSFYWRVRAFNEAGGWSEWNVQSRSFVNGLKQVQVPPPAVPILTAPAVGVILSGNSVAFSWSQVKNAVKYQLQIGTNNSFDTFFFNNSNINATSHTVPNFPPGANRYYWRVRAGSAAGIWGEWSESRMFNTN